MTMQNSNIAKANNPFWLLFKFCEIELINYSANAIATTTVIATRRTISINNKLIAQEKNYVVKKVPVR